MDHCIHHIHPFHSSYDYIGVHTFQMVADNQDNRRTRVALVDMDRVVHLEEQIQQQIQDENESKEQDRQSLDVTLDVLEHHQGYFPVRRDCEMNYSYMDFEPYKDEKLVVDDSSDDHIQLVVAACDRLNTVVPCEDRIHPFVAVPFDSVAAVQAVAFAVVDMLVELVVAVNIVDFVASVDFVAFVGVVEYFVVVAFVADSVAENFVASNIAETVMVPFVEPVTSVAVTFVAVTFAAETFVAVTSLVVTSEVVTWEAETFGVVTFGVVAIGVVTIVGEQYVDILVDQLLDLLQQLIDLNLELIYLKWCVVDSTLTPSSILDLSKFYLLVLDLLHAV